MYYDEVLTWFLEQQISSEILGIYKIRKELGWRIKASIFVLASSERYLICMSSFLLNGWFQSREAVGENLTLQAAGAEG